MEAKTIPAHFDGTQILLDEPFELTPDMKLVVTIIPESVNSEREDWAKLALKNLSRAYGDEEPDYPLSLIKEANPAYEER